MKSVKTIADEYMQSIPLKQIFHKIPIINLKISINQINNCWFNFAVAHCCIRKNNYLELCLQFPDYAISDKIYILRDATQLCPLFCMFQIEKCGFPSNAVELVEQAFETSSALWQSIIWFAITGRMGEQNMSTIFETDGSIRLSLDA